MSESLIVQNLEKVRFEIAEAEKKSGRPSGSVSLCAVSKFHPKEAVFEALKANQILFGENRVQEAFEKFNLIKDDGLNFNLHIIGSLQSNKVKKACQVASCIQSVDRLSLLEEIEKQCSKLEKNINVFFEFHTAEDSKSGYGSESELFESIEKCAAGIFPHIVPQGLMTMAPFTSDEIMVHKSFETLRLLRDKIYFSFDYKNFELSMGMSGDYKIAIEEGSTMVRVGTAIFGERDYSK